jgi:DNA-binding NtrC family response regulator
VEFFRKKLTAAELALELRVWGRLPPHPLAEPLFAACDGRRGEIVYGAPGGAAPTLGEQRAFLNQHLAALGVAVPPPEQLRLHSLAGRGAPAFPLKPWPPHWPQPEPGPAPVSVTLRDSLEPPPPEEPLFWRGAGADAGAALLQAAGVALLHGGIYLYWRADLDPEKVGRWLTGPVPGPRFIDCAGRAFTPPPGWSVPAAAIVLTPEPPLQDWPILAAPEAALPAGADGVNGPVSEDSGPVIKWLRASGPWPLAAYETLAEKFHPGGPVLGDIAAGRLSVSGGEAQAAGPGGEPPPAPDAALAALLELSPLAALRLVLAARMPWPDGLALRLAAEVPPETLLAALQSGTGRECARLRVRALLDLGRVRAARGLLGLADLQGELELRWECEALAESPDPVTPPPQTARARFFAAFAHWRRGGRAGALAALEGVDADALEGAVAALRAFLAHEPPPPLTPPGDAPGRERIWAGYFTARARRVDLRERSGPLAEFTALYQAALTRGWSFLRALNGLMMADIHRQQFQFAPVQARLTELRPLFAESDDCFIRKTRESHEGLLAIESGRPRTGLRLRRLEGNPINRFWHAQALLLAGEETAALAALQPLLTGPEEDLAHMAEFLRVQLLLLQGTEVTWPRQYAESLRPYLLPLEAAVASLTGESVNLPAPPDPESDPDLYAVSAPPLIAARLLSGAIAPDAPELARALAGAATVAVPLLLLLVRRRPALLKHEALAAGAERWAELLEAEVPGLSREIREAIMAQRPLPLERFTLDLLELAGGQEPVKAISLKRMLGAQEIHLPPHAGDWPLRLQGALAGIAGSPWMHHAAGRALCEYLLGGVPLAGEAAPAAARVVEGFYFGSAPSLHLLEEIETAAPFPIPVFIRGPAGSGKEGVATLLHRLSHRRGRLVPVNCASLERELADAQLFGAKRGAYTGLTEDRPGWVAEAEGGTLFLDEFLDLPLPAQAKLLRFLESGEYYRLGESKPHQAKTRIVCAAGGDVEAALAAGRLRPDLWSRVSGIILWVPPLGQRRGEILPLIGHFIERLAAEQGQSVPSISSALASRLIDHDWPGQVRELRRCAEHLLLKSRGRSELRPEDLPPQLRPAREAAPAELTVGGGDSLPGRLERIERQLITEAVTAADGKFAAAARKLGISRQALFQKMKRLGMGEAPAAGVLSEGSAADLGPD